MDYGPAPESTAAAEAWLATHDRHFGHFIAGRFVPPAGGTRFTSYNPAHRTVLAEIAAADAADVEQAVCAAEQALPAWQALGGHGRARHLYALARLVQKHARLLAVVETLDNGKPIRETRDIDVPLAARHFYHHAGWAGLCGERFPGLEPWGVCGQIIPWNFPLLMLAWKVAPALAAGNTVVLKPAEYTSLSALLFAELAAQAGLPPGVLNLVTGDGRTGEIIVDHPRIAKIAFTGSTEVGKQIRRRLAGSGKGLTLELGGKSPFIVFDDADLDGAVEGLVDAIWFNQGQVCCAGSRLLMHEGIAERFIAKVKARMGKLRVGEPLDKGIDIGAIVDPVQTRRIAELVAQGVAEGATLWQPDGELPAAGEFYPPTLLTDVSPAHTVVREEIFGPVLVAMTFRTPREAIELANNTRYGLAASVWSEDLNRALEVAPALKAGVVWINSTNLFDAAAGFGGYRESGFGREGGREGMLAYLKPAWHARLKPAPLSASVVAEAATPETAGIVAIDRTAKQFIAGRQMRPDGGNSLTVSDHAGLIAGEVALGNHKDIRNAVEAAAGAPGWSRSSAHQRAQVLYYVAENLDARRAEFASRLVRLTGCDLAGGEREVDAALERLFRFAGWADQFDGQVHSPPLRGVTLAMNEPLGVLAIVCPDEAPLLACITMCAAALALGNRLVVVPSERYPLPVTDLYQVIETSDVPAGALNIVTGRRAELGLVLARHAAVDGLWYHGPAEECAAAEREAADNMKRTWTSGGLAYDWYDVEQTAGESLLRRTVEVKNIWIPYGEQV